MQIIDGTASTEGLRFALIVANYNDFITDRLQKGALDGLVASGVSTDDIVVVRVPGAFEIPVAARLAAETGRFDGIVCLGCLIKGATPHFDFIAAAVAHGLVGAAADTAIPMAFGVLTTNSAEEALERAVDGPSNKGWEAALAALEMAVIARQLAPDAPAT